MISKGMISLNRTQRVQTGKGINICLSSARSKPLIIDPDERRRRYHFLEWLDLRAALQSLDLTETSSQQPCRGNVVLDSENRGRGKGELSNPPRWIGFGSRSRC